MDPMNAIGSKTPCGTYTPSRTGIHHPHRIRTHKNTALHSSSTPRRQGSADGAAWMCRRQSRGALRRAAWLRRTKNSEIHPTLRARARSSAVGSAQSQAAPQALPCPQARHAPHPNDTPASCLPAPPPRADHPEPKGHGSAKGVEGMCREAQQ